MAWADYSACILRPPRPPASVRLPAAIWRASKPFSTPCWITAFIWPPLLTRPVLYQARITIPRSTRLSQRRAPHLQHSPGILKMNSPIIFKTFRACLESFRLPSHPIFYPGRRGIRHCLSQHWQIIGAEPARSGKKCAVRYYLVAILFIIFDLETAFLFPWGAALRDIGWPGFFAMMFFLFELILGFAYIWKRGGLDWV